LIAAVVITYRTKTRTVWKRWKNHRHFCRAMLCPSAAYAVARCLSVRHVRVLCQNE